jgi:hypothetical protein
MGLFACGSVMNDRARECLERAAECVRLAEAGNNPELTIQLVNLASSWARAAARENLKELQSV